MSSVATEAFKEFWEMTYMRIEQPKEGWPKEIQNCLQVAMGITPVSESSVKSLMAPPTLAAAFCPSPSPALSTSSTQAVGSDSPRPSTPTPSTPSRSCASTPTRPQKSINFFTTFPAPMQSPGSPVRSSIPFPSSSYPQSPQRTPGTPRYTPRSAHRSSLSSKRRKLGNEDKENQSPSARLLIRSVEERISTRAAEDQARTTKPSTLGKRRLEEDVNEDRPSPPKKGRKLNFLPDEDSEDEKDVEASLVATLSVAEDVFSSKYSNSFNSAKSVELVLAPPKKRKRIFMEAVEVPTLRELYPRLRYTASFDSLRTPSSSPLNSTRQTRSTTRAASAQKMRAVDISSRKRRRASAEDIFSSSPLRALEIPRSDSFTLTKAKTEEELPSPDVLSSDDDPHFGQVTPHRIISPELRRVRGAHFEDPPSDDSIILASPSRDHAERRLQRLGSLNGLPKPIPFAV